MAKRKVAPKVDDEKRIGPFQIRSVYLKQASIYTAPEFDPLVANQKLHGFNKISQAEIVTRKNLTADKLRPEFVSVSVGTMFHFGYSFHESLDDLSGDDQESAFVAKVSAQIVADYAVTSNETPTEEDLKKWAMQNALLHSYPYWREFCQNTLLRMNLTPTIMPLLNLNSK